MSFQTKVAVGYNGSTVQYVGPDEAAWASGNTIILHNLHTKVQRVIKAGAFGTSCFAVNKKQHLIAVAEKGLVPNVTIYSTAAGSNLQPLQVISPTQLGVQLGVTALAFSTDGERLLVCGDEPDCSMVVYAWRQAAVLVSSKLAMPAHHGSFHPLDASLLATTGGGSLTCWQLERQWERFELKQRPVTLPPGQDATCHAWSPAGLYIGCGSGQLLLLDMGTLQPMALAGGPAVLQGASLGASVSALALNRDYVVVGGTDGVARVYSHAAVATASQMPALSHEIGFGVVGIASLAMGGHDLATLLAGCPDAVVYRAAVHPAHANGPAAAAQAPVPAAPAVVADCHVGAISGVAAHPAGGAFITAGSDGSVRVWGARDGALASKRTFSSAQTALAAAPPTVGALLAAVGSATGVLRVLALSPEPLTPPAQPLDGAEPLRVAYRRRLHTSPITSIAFSPTAELLATASRDGSVWLCSLDTRTGAARALGHVSAPEPVLCLSWPAVSDADESVLVSLAGGGVMCISVPPEMLSGNWRNPAPDLALKPGLGLAVLDVVGGAGAGGAPAAATGTAISVTMKLLKIEVPLLAAASIPGERYGELYGLGADKQLHRVVLPSEGPVWAGLRARPHKSALHVPAHARPGGAVAVAPGGHMLLCGSTDGSASLRNMSLIALATTDDDGAPSRHGGRGGAAASGAAAGTVSAGLHDTSAGGISAVAFDTSARFFATAGADGALFVYELTSGGGHATIATPGRLPAAHLHSPGSGSGTLQDLDDVDEESELTEAVLASRGSAEGVAGVGAEARRAAVAARLAGLRQRLAEAVAANDAVPALEQLDRSEFVIDRGLVKELQAAAEERVAAVRERVRRQHLQNELLAERLKRLAWDSMAVKGVALGGLRSSQQVHNFAMTQPGPNERTLRQVTMLRRVEAAEHASLGVVSNKVQLRASVTATSDDAVLENAPDSAPARDGQAGASSSTSGAADPLDSLLYSEFDLHCAMRRNAQMHLLKDKIRQLMSSFNAAYAKVAAQKRGDSDKIADLSARLDDTLKDLRKLGAGPPPGLLDDRFVLPAHASDDVEVCVLSVRDEEVAVDKFVSDEDRAKVDAARRAEDEAAKRSAKDNASERALRQMMGGTLAGKGGAAEGADAFSAPRPAWLAPDADPEALNLKQLTEEQLKELKEWQAKDKALQEERAKRIGVLELELRTAKSAIEEVVARYDEALAALALRRHKTSAEIAALEAQVLCLAAGLLRSAKCSEGAERALMTKLGSAKEAWSKVASELADRRHALAEADARHTQAQADERQLDRNFKKEFADSDVHFNRLQQLYKMRRAQPADAPAGAGAPSDTGEGAGRSLGRQASRAGSAAPSAAALSPAAAADAAATLPALPSSGLQPPPAVPPALAATTLDPFPDVAAAAHLLGGYAAAATVSEQSHALGSHHLVGIGHGGARREAGASSITGGPAPGLAGLHHPPGAGGRHAAVDEAEVLDSSWRPEGLDSTWWERFQAYRSERLLAEATVRLIGADLALLRRAVPELEGREGALAHEMEAVMADISALRMERKLALYDGEMQLHLLAGQVEAEPPSLASADMSDARLLPHTAVEGLNSTVLAKGGRKVEILTQIKDFKRGIYQAQWEVAAAEMMLEDLRNKIKDLQLLHVTRDMQAVLKSGGEDRSVAQEVASLEALSKQRERLQAKAIADRQKKLRKLGVDCSSRASQNNEVALHLVTLGKVLEEQQRLQSGMQSATEAAARRMRSLVTHKKLKEIALSQQAEMAELSARLENLRKRTYPSFQELEQGATGLMGTGGANGMGLGVSRSSYAMSPQRSELRALSGGRSGSASRAGGMM